MRSTRQRNNGSDQDSDFGYTTNQPDIVAHAKMCYRRYPTIVNNIPKEQNIYHNTMDDFAAIDSGLAKSQLDIGESSNLAQTYACNYNDTKYLNYVCILSVLAQVAIDSAKRRFQIDLSAEIKRIKDDMDIRKHKYPDFWRMIKKDFNKGNINNKLTCPMNYLSSLNLNRYRNEKATLPMSHFFQKFELDTNRAKNKKIEELIQKYSVKLLYYNASSEDRETKNEEARSVIHTLPKARSALLSIIYSSKLTAPFKPLLVLSRLPCLIRLQKTGLQTM